MERTENEIKEDKGGRNKGGSGGRIGKKEEIVQGIKETPKENGSKEETEEQQKEGGKRGKEYWRMEVRKDERALVRII